MDIHTKLVYSHTEYDVTNYFWSDVAKGKKPLKMLLPTTWGGISREQFELGSRNSICLSETTGLTNLPDMTSPAASCWLQCAIIPAQKCIKLVRPKSRIIQPLFNVGSPNFARPSRPTHSIDVLDMTSPSTSGRDLE